MHGPSNGSSLCRTAAIRLKAERLRRPGAPVRLPGDVDVGGTTTVAFPQVAGSQPDRAGRSVPCGVGRWTTCGHPIGLFTDHIA